MRLIQSFLRDDDAATAVEYAVMLALIIMTVLGTIGTVGAETGGMWGSIVGELRSVGFMP